MWPRTSSVVRSRPIAWTWSRHGEIARMPCRRHASMIVSSVPAPRSVAVLIESQRWSQEKSRTASVARPGSAVDSVQREQVAHARHRELGLLDQAGAIGEAKDLGEVRQRASALLAADHREMRLVTVQPGQEDDAGL